MDTGYRLYVNNMVRRTYDTAEMAEDFGEQVGMDSKSIRTMTLLMEETIGMVCSMAGPFEAEIWLEGDAKACRVCLEARVGDGMPGEGIPEGFMAKVGNLLRCSFLFDDREEVPAPFRDAIPSYMSDGLPDAPMMVGRWSLGIAREKLRIEAQDNDQARKQLEELEMSIVANVADEVTIGIQDNRIRLVIDKGFPASAAHRA